LSNVIVYVGGIARDDHDERKGKVKGINVLLPHTDRLFLKLNGILWIMTTLMGLVHQRLRRREAMEYRRHSVDTYVSSIRRARSRLGERQDLDLEEFDISMSDLYPRSPPATMWKERICTRYTDDTETDRWTRDISRSIDVLPLKAVHGRAVQAPPPPTATPLRVG